MSSLHALLVNSVMMGGGVDSHTLTLARALLGQGMQVTLALPASSRWRGLAERIEGLQMLALPGRRQWWPMRLAHEMRQRQIDVIHAHHGRDYWVAKLAAWMASGRVGVVVTRHLMTPLKAKTRRLLGRSTQVIAVSDAVVRTLHPTGGLSVHRIHCGIDVDGHRPDADVRQRERARLGYAEDDVVFAVIGPIHAPEGKGQFYFVEAAAQLHRDQPHARFLCVGDGDSIDRLRDRAAALGLGGSFAIHPFTDRLADLMQAIDVLVHPAVSSEALGLVILEGLACGKPAIASQLDGIAETFRDPVQGYLVPPRDAPALAQAMGRLASDAALRQRMGHAGQGWVADHFSLSRLGEQTHQVYLASLSRSPRT